MNLENCDFCSNTVKLYRLTNKRTEQLKTHSDYHDVTAEPLLQSTVYTEPEQGRERSTKPSVSSALTVCQAGHSLVRIAESKVGVVVLRACSEKSTDILNVYLSML